MLPVTPNPRQPGCRTHSYAACHTQSCQPATPNPTQPVTPNPTSLSHPILCSLAVEPIPMQPVIPSPMQPGCRTHSYAARHTQSYAVLSTGGAVKHNPLSHYGRLSNWVNGRDVREARCGNSTVGAGPQPACRSIKSANAAVRPPNRTLSRSSAISCLGNCLPLTHSWKVYMCLSNDVYLGLAVQFSSGWYLGALEWPYASIPSLKGFLSIGFEIDPVQVSLTMVIFSCRFFFFLKENFCFYFPRLSLSGDRLCDFQALCPQVVTQAPNTSDLSRGKPLVMDTLFASLSARSFPFTPACQGQYSHKLSKVDGDH